LLRIVHVTKYRHTSFNVETPCWRRAYGFNTSFVVT